MTSGYLARTYKGTPETGNASEIEGYNFWEFIGVDLEISEVMWQPTRANTPHWIAITKWFGDSIDISLWLEDIEFLGATLGIDIPQGQSTNLPDVTWIQIRTADMRLKRLKGISCVIDNGVTIYPPQDTAAPTVAENATVERQVNETGIPHYQPGETDALEEIKALCQEPRYVWYIASFMQSSSMDILFGNPFSVRIETQPGHSVAIKMYDIAPFEPAEFQRKIEALAGERVQVTIKLHRVHKPDYKRVPEWTS